MNAEDIREHMPIVDQDGNQFGTVDHADGDAVKVTKDQQGQHHWIPMSWVTYTDDKLHVDRPADQATREWMKSPPKAA